MGAVAAICCQKDRKTVRSSGFQGFQEGDGEEEHHKEVQEENIETEI